MPMSKKAGARMLRKARIRKKIVLRNSERPRLSVFRSGKHIYAQIIDDRKHSTLVTASTICKELKGTVKKPATVEAAVAVGQLIAKKAKEKNITEVSFDRGGYLFHGRVKALADAARKEGLNF